MIKITYAELTYKINKLSFKGNQLIIRPKATGYNSDQPIIIDLT